jgi:hypothetical protein
LTSRFSISTPAHTSAWSEVVASTMPCPLPPRLRPPTPRPPLKPGRSPSGAGPDRAILPSGEKNLRSGRFFAFRLRNILLYSRYENDCASPHTKLISSRGPGWALREAARVCGRDLYPRIDARLARTAGFESQASYQIILPTGSRPSAARSLLRSVVADRNIGFSLSGPGYSGPAFSCADHHIHIPRE